MDNLYNAGDIAGDEIIFAPKQNMIMSPVCRTTISGEINEDITLPDYNSEFRRLMKVTPRISVPSCYAGGGLAEFSGTVTWCVLYIGADGKLAYAEPSSSFDASAEFDAKGIDGSDYTSTDDITVEGMSCRVTAPRKLSIHCRLVHRISVYGEKSTETVPIGEVDESTVKKLTKVVPAAKTVSATDDSVELEDTFPLPDNADLIGTKATVCINNAVAKDGEIEATGTLCLKLLYCIGTEEPVCMEHKLQFTANAIADLEGDGWNCCGYGKTISVTAETDGTNVNCRIRICVVLEAQKNMPVEFTADMFSTENECNSVRSNISVPCAMLCGIYRYSHEASSETETDTELTPIFADCTAEAEYITVEKGRYVLNGNCKYTVLYSGNNELSCRETEFPFKCDLGGNAAEKPEDYTVCISVLDCKIKREGENTAYSADLCISCRILGKTETDAIVAADFGYSIERGGASFTVAYASAGETLWDIAKRYSCDPAELADMNGIKLTDPDAPDSLKGVKYLII